MVKHSLGNIILSTFFFVLFGVFIVESQQTEPVAIVPGEHVLDKTKCLEALAAIRHAKWFQVCLFIYYFPA